MTGPMTWQTILCPIDFSAGARSALEHAIALGAATGARVLLLHVYSPISTFLPDSLMSTSPVVMTQIERDIQTELARWLADAKTLAAGRVEVAARADLGLPFGSIVAAAEAMPADVIVMGTHGRTGFKHLLVGSVAERVMRFAPCPVLTVREGRAATAVRRILVASDLTASSEVAVRAALELAGKLDATASVLHVREGDFHNRALFESQVPEDRDLLAKISGRELESASRALDQQVQSLLSDPHDGQRVETLIRTGIPADVVVSTAASMDADLVVVGTHGRRGFQHALLGSVAERIVRVVPVPVLTVPSRAK